MKLPALLVTDLHLTDRPEDAYRWELFPQLQKVIKREGVRTVAFLGDTTDAKDYHSASLVNRVVNALVSVRNTEPCERLMVLMGNHDYLRDGHPYLNFLNHIPGVNYVTKPLTDLDDCACLWLPHTRSPVKDWASVLDVSWFEFLFMHQTVQGSHAGHGQHMGGDGSDAAFMHWQGPLPQIWSGDIHVPQTLKVPGGAVVNYVGSPYHVHFGDDFTPRGALLILENRKVEDVPLQFPSRYSIKVDGVAGLRRARVSAGDQVKLVVTLAQAEAHEWPRVRNAATAWAERQGVILADLRMKLDTTTRRRIAVAATERSAQPEDVLRDFVEREELGADAFDEALEFLK